MVEQNKKNKNHSSKFNFNKNIFDIIDTQEKAYWIGFLWCDGYVLKRKNRNEYSIKLELGIKDKDHLEKFKAFIDSNHNINEYKYPKSHTCRLMFSNSYLGIKLQEDYGLIPNRSSIKKLMNSIPYELMSHFFRGVFDAEGSVSFYKINENHNKAAITLCTYEDLVDCFQDYLIKKKIKNNKVLAKKRHEGRDGNAIQLTLSGYPQVYKIANLLYDGSTVHMDRKFNKIKENDKERGLLNV